VFTAIPTPIVCRRIAVLVGPEQENDRILDAASLDDVFGGA
jgi:hypothetical protein